MKLVDNKNLINIAAGYNSQANNSAIVQNGDTFESEYSKLEVLKPIVGITLTSIAIVLFSAHGCWGYLAD